MKKILFSFSLTLISYLSYCQISFGVKSGINIATTKDIITFPKNRIGWYVGGIANIPIHKNIFLQPELLFSTKGYRYIDGAFGSTTSRRLNYIAVPILLDYKIDQKLSLLFGTEIGYLLSAQLIFSNNERFNISKNYPVKLDVGLDIGLNYKIVRRIGIEIRYNYGFKNMYTTDAAGNRIGEAWGGNRVFQIGGFYSLNKSK